ncbi:hydantoinase/oxoprolinase family protein [Oceanidesulfovibrio marinus]|uniref:Hydantoinase/oxoprolinase family protein n=1 Tax=Oceanidesulfovibrio marinus TaxID=370038 RepID=A0ABX6NHG3_9BACT|nr:hydantoinase/oxoprolinase family protein [Oceanidesulfovibrio marinus]QJT10079.1 hydantoinase/oxoprolinase family protein [Oceanidesulfovibrio marinus]
MRIIGVDTGGTFTDLIYKDGEAWKVHKLLSTPSNPAEAVLAGLAAVAPDAGRMVVHGSTVATNAILERKGVRTALVTNDRFTDVIVIGRQNRSRLYDLAYRHESPIVPEELRFGAPGRINSAGEELEPLTEEDAKRVADLVRESGAESVAVCLLFSFARPEHEQRLGQALAELGIPVSLSHEIVSEFREFERMSTTVVNAYVSPKMHRYLSFLEDRLFEGDSLRIMQSNGGSISAATAMHESVRTILSGPAGGVVGALEIGTLAGHPKLITFDMGGTSSDVALMDGALSLTMESSISGYPVKTPMIDIHTVGAGGGSIAAVDAGGSLTVGPESAGADPGPICYGKGSDITVTDANLFLGRLIPEHFLGGNMELDLKALDKPFAEMSAKLGLTPVELAEGILAVANANMERAIRVISVERGFDPREFTLFSFGGAGGLHAASLAKLLNMEKVFIPKNPGILSAVGMLLADIVKDYSHTVMFEAAACTPATISEALAPLEARGSEDLAAEGVEPERMTFERYLDMRYEGQSYEILTPFDPDAADIDTVVEAFHELHERTYGYRNQAKPVQVVNVRLRARGTPIKPTFAKMELAGETPPEAADLGEREVIFDDVALPTRVYRREELKAGNVIPGPAVLVEYTSTLLVPPYATAVVDEYENLILTIS